MRSVQINEYGSAEVAKIVEDEKPRPSVGQLLIKVKASSVNPVDIQIREGHYEDFTPLPFKLGFDGAGIVESVGSNDSEFTVGDRVYFVPQIFNGVGTYGDYAVVETKFVAKIPNGLDYNEAAALSLAGSAAWESLITRGRLKEDEIVLIHAGAGGVGHIAIQVAHAIGAKVIATGKRKNLDTLESLGANVSLDYEDPSFIMNLKEATKDGVHLVLDSIGGSTISDSAEILLPYGRIVSLADYSPPQNLQELWPKNAEINLFYMSPSNEYLNKLNYLVDQGKLRVIVDKVFPLEKVVEAHKYMTKRGRVGKVVLSVN